MTCDQAREFLKIKPNLLTRAERWAVRGHVRNCQDCISLFANVRANGPAFAYGVAIIATDLAVDAECREQAARGD